MNLIEAMDLKSVYQNQLKSISGVTGVGVGMTPGSTSNSGLYTLFVFVNSDFTPIGEREVEGLLTTHTDFEYQQSAY